MSETVNGRVVSFLELNRYKLLESWLDKVIIAADDPFNEKVFENGLSMLNMLIAYLNSHLSEKDLRELACQVAQERLIADTNIGEFVYNVSIGRSEIFHFLPQTGLSIAELHPLMDKINFCFDKFLHFAVQHYTELKDQRLQEQSSFIEQTHKDRLTILGQMASSFVHEFRNPLTSVIGFVKLLQEKYPDLEYLDVMTKELNELKFRISQFLLVSKKEIKEKEKEQFQLSLICEETMDFLYPMIVSTDVSVEIDVDSSLYLYGYREEFRQVLINILMNSLDALASTPLKIVRIMGKKEQDFAAIRISNNGPMISDKMIHSIFEPFVSTKKLGTGIGLYICRKIIEEHHGTITCESNEEWTTFHIKLPESNEKG